MSRRQGRSSSASSLLEADYNKYAIELCADYLQEAFYPGFKKAQSSIYISAFAATR